MWSFKKVCLFKLKSININELAKNNIKTSKYSNTSPCYTVIIASFQLLTQVVKPDLNSQN